MFDIFGHKYPYQDAHELNLDWILEQLKLLKNNWEEFKAISTIEYKGIWNITAQYPKYSIVTDGDGIGWLSIKPVPSGIELSNVDYWLKILDYTYLFNEFRERFDNIEDYLNNQVLSDLHDVDLTSLEVGNSIYWNGEKWVVLDEAFVNVKLHGAYGDGVHDDTVAIQTCLDNYHNIIFPDGVYKVTAPLKFNQNDSIIQGCGNSVLNCTANLTTSDSAFEVHGMYVYLNNVKFRYSGTSDPFAVVLIGKTTSYSTDNGFNCNMYGCTVNGSENTTTTSGIFVGSAEFRCSYCKIRGAYNGINVNAPDSNFYDIYTEYNTRNGFYANSYGSIDAYHIHAYNNGRDGFFIGGGAAFSNFNECYADTNTRQGFTCDSVTGILNFVNCWSFRTATEYGWFITGCKKITLDNCRVTSSNGYGDFRISNSTGLLTKCNCTGNNPINMTNSHVVVEHSTGTLEKYNTIDLSFKTGFMSPNTTKTIEIATNILVADLIEYEQLLFVVNAGFRDYDMTVTGLKTYNASVGYMTNINAIELMNSDNTYFTINSLTGDYTGEYVKLSLSITSSSTLTNDIAIGGKLDYKSTVRGGYLPY